MIVAGLEMLRAIYAQPAFKDLWDVEMMPADTDLWTYAQTRGGTVYHASGTCRMSDDGRSPVDAQLRVRGVERLRVIDASVMPTVVSANTNAATYMIAERGVEMVLNGR